MTSIKHIGALLILGLSLVIAPLANAELPKTTDGAYIVKLDQYNGYFSAEETLGGLKAGEYEFVVTNKAGKLVGFQIQNFQTHETLDMFPLEPGETRVARVTVSTDGVRYRCPINPTPWYDLDNIK